MLIVSGCNSAELQPLGQSRLGLQGPADRVARLIGDRAALPLEREPKP